VNLVMRFHDGRAASATKAALTTTNAAHVRTSIPCHSDASAYDMPRRVIVESFAAHGPYILHQWVQTKNSVAAGTELVAKILDLQGPRIDQFIPTDPSLLAGLSSTRTDSWPIPCPRGTKWSALPRVSTPRGRPFIFRRIP
jgi:hypothetical protein